MSDMLDNFRKYLDSPEGQRSLEEFAAELNAKDERDERNMMRVIKYISNLSDEQLHKALLNFFRWETEFEEKYYKKYIQTCSMLFDAVLNTWNKIGDEVDFDEDFFAGGASYRGYIFKTYCGQGCFTKVIHKNENIFQTT